MWGIGASAGPLIMAMCISGGSWSQGFLVLGGIQVAISVVLTLSLPLWRDRALPSVEKAAGDVQDKRRSRRALLRVAGVPSVLICFFCYCALESTCGNWAATFCTLARGIDAETAASWAALFYIGITAGRAVSGFISMRLRDHHMIRLGQLLIALGVVLVIVPAGDRALIAGLLLIGAGCAPIYPSIIHATPYRFGEDVALELTGMQMAVAYVGSLVMSPLFGVLAQMVGAELYPLYLAVILVVMIAAAEHLNAVMRRARS